MESYKVSYSFLKPIRFGSPICRNSSRLSLIPVNLVGPTPLLYFLETLAGWVLLRPASVSHYLYAQLTRVGKYLPVLPQVEDPRATQIYRSSFFFQLPSLITLKVRSPLGQAGLITKKLRLSFQQEKGGRPGSTRCLPLSFFFSFVWS